MTLPWVRGNQSTDIELSRVQSWIEGADPELFGKIGDPGVIRQFREDRTARIQKEADTEQFMKRRVQWITLLGGLVALLKIGELLHIIPK